MNTRFPISLLVLFLATTSFSQRVVDVDKLEGNALAFLNVVGGEPIMTTKFVRVVDGTPYFSANWIKGSAFIGESEYRNLLLRVNLLETSLEFRDNKGEIMVCTTPIKEVKLHDSATGKNYSFIHSSFLPRFPDNAKPIWFQLLSSGNASFYKFIRKQVNESLPYGAATTEQRIANINTLFILFNGEWFRIKKTTDIPDLLTSKKQELLNYIKTNELSPRDENDMVRLINYFNTL